MISAPPMTIDPLRNPKLKLERARTHIRDLDGLIRSFRESRPYRMTEESHPDGVNKNIKVKLVREIPSEIALTAADAVHNLRVSLDQLTCRLAEANGASSTSDTYFPFGKNAQIFETEVRRKTKKLHPDAVLAIKRLKPYQGGNDLLWAVNALDVTDKHREIVAIGSISPSARVNLTGGQRIETPGWTGMFIRGPIQITANPVWNVLDESATVMTAPSIRHSRGRSD